ncbi:hypothetical protein ACF0H5_011762 [Mactra antiquata]
MSHFEIGVHLFFSCVSTQSLDCPAGWASSRTDKSRPCYLITNKLLRTWQAAQTFCSQMGGFLWKIDNAVEKVSTNMCMCVVCFQWLAMIAHGVGRGPGITHHGRVTW